jgi:hypothetical protein
MKLSDTAEKCVSILFTDNQKDKASEVRMNQTTLMSVKQTYFLGVTLDTQLTMKPHFMNIIKEGKKMVSQLCCVTNSCFAVLPIVVLTHLSFLCGTCMLPTFAMSSIIQHHHGLGLCHKSIYLNWNDFKTETLEQSLSFHKLQECLICTLKQM